jgi:tetratricopeptide (TPR) repeat protein
MTPRFDPSGLVTFLHWYVEYLDRDFSAALEIVAASDREYVEFQEVLFPKTLLMGFSYEALGEADLARATADSARRGLAARLRERPEDPRLHTALSYTHAVLGNRDAAVRAAQQAVELMPISKDAMEGPEYVWNLAIIYAAFGEVDAAVE